MNLWWPLLVLLGCSWFVPLFVLRQAQVGWPFFVGVGCLWSVVLVFIEPLYDWGTTLQQQLKWTAMADWRMREKPRILPPARTALLIMAASSFVFGLLQILGL